jgi:hypothetical protein
VTSHLNILTLLSVRSALILANSTLARQQEQSERQKHPIMLGRWPFIENRARQRSAAHTPLTRATGRTDFDAGAPPEKYMQLKGCI